MTEAEVGNDENLRNESLDIISNEASNLKDIYMAKKRQTKIQVDRLKKSHAACSPSKLKFSGESKKEPPMLTLEKLSREWKVTYSWLREVEKFMLTNYNDQSVIRDLGKARVHYEAYMGDKLKAALRVKFDRATSVRHLKAALEDILMQEWPLIRRRATLLIWEQKGESYEAYVQDIRDLVDFARVADTKKVQCGEPRCKGRPKKCYNCGRAVKLELEEFIAMFIWNGIKDKKMKVVIAQKLSNSKKVLTAENALEIIKNITTGAVAAAPKKGEKKEGNSNKEGNKEWKDKRCNYCYRTGHLEANCHNRPGERFNPEGKKERPEKPKGWKEYRETKKGRVALAKNDEREPSETEALDTSGATDDEGTIHTGSACRVRIVRAAKAISEDDSQTLIAARHRKSTGWKQIFFCDSGADVSMVTETKARRDRMPIDTEGAKRLKIVDVTGNDVQLVGSVSYTHLTLPTICSV